MCRGILKEEPKEGVRSRIDVTGKWFVRGRSPDNVNEKGVGLKEKKVHQGSDRESRSPVTCLQRKSYSGRTSKMNLVLMRS